MQAIPAARNSADILFTPDIPADIQILLLVGRVVKI
jgi:hypothetical protein